MEMTDWAWRLLDVRRAFLKPILVETGWCKLEIGTEIEIRPLTNGV
jgi:hypothetical protein